MSRLNHNSSPSDVANSTQTKFVMEGLVMWLKAGAILNSYTKWRQSPMSCTCVIGFVTGMSGSSLACPGKNKIWTPMEVKGSVLLA